MWLRILPALATILSMVTSASAQVLGEDNLLVTSPEIDFNNQANESELSDGLQFGPYFYTRDGTNNNDADDVADAENGQDVLVKEDDSEPDEAELIPDTDQDTSSEVESEIERPEPVVVQTTHGPVEGHLLHDETILGYFDIPYGEFNEYFNAPSEPDVWVETLKNSEHGKICPQMQNDDTVIGSTDCLTLSVFTPAHAVDAAVLFHIHDGQFKFGSGSPALYGPENLVSKGVIVVLPNYRLGPLGFLCLRDESAPGNAALKDLTLALQWTANNIDAFGGDSSNIVVSGEGLAGALIGYLALSPKSSLYFNKAITESGTVLSQLAIDRDPLDTAAKLARTLTDGETDDVKVIGNFTFQELVKSSKNIIFRPCVETTPDSFTNTTPWKMLQENKINMTFMMGSVSHAGWHDVIDNSLESTLEICKNFTHLLPNDLIFKSAESASEAATSIRTQYFQKEDITTDDVDNLVLYYTDASYTGPAIRTARSLIEAGATVYFYEFSYLGDLNSEPAARPVTVAGAKRGDTVRYLFTRDRHFPESGSEDEKMVNVMTDLWVSFMKTGRPSAEDTAWNSLRAVDEAKEEWLLIDAKRELHRGLHVKRLSVWTRLYREHFVDSSLAAPGTARLNAQLLLAVALMTRLILTQ